MSETKKTLGQVYMEALYAQRGWLLPKTDLERAGLFELAEGPAAAVVAAHEAQRTAWPPMRPMSELRQGGAALLYIVKLDRDGGTYGRIEIGALSLEDGFVDERGMLIHDLVEGWWPLPEVPR